MSDHKFIAYFKNLMTKLGHANGLKKVFSKVKNNFIFLKKLHLNSLSEKRKRKTASERRS